MKIQRMTLRDTLTKRSMQKDRKILMLNSIAVIASCDNIITVIFIGSI